MRWYFILIISLFAAIFTAVLVLFAVGYVLFAKTMKKKSKSVLKPNKAKQTDEYRAYRSSGQAFLSQQKIEKLTVKTDKGICLSAEYIKNPAKKGTIICVHGYKSSGKKDFGGIINYLYSRGLSILLPDSRAHGSSGGRYLGFGVLDSRDTLLWVDKIKEFGEERIYLYGISMGCAAVTMAAADCPAQVKGIIADCGFTSPIAQLKYNFKAVRAPVLPLYFASFWCRVFAGYSYDGLSSIDSLKKSAIPVLFFHGAEDRLVPLKMSEDNYALTAAPKKLVVVNNAGHALCHYTDTKAYEKEIDDFFGFLKQVR